MPVKRRPPTAAQVSYLKALCAQTGQPFDPRWSKDQASAKITELQRRLGKGGWS
jgi:hypothetical protein